MLGRKHPHSCGEDHPPGRRNEHHLETPPLVWGRPSAALSAWRVFGNTPTRVGKTSFGRLRARKLKKHPHSCGEDPPSQFRRAVGQETPPLVWGRQSASERSGVGSRNTPTRVGKTANPCQTNASNRKHPHSCGEDLVDPAAVCAVLETPPLVWGRRSGTVPLAGQQRNTPTRVGKTWTPSFSSLANEKHPHSCGEDLHWIATGGTNEETPPLVWGRPRTGGWQSP